MTESGVSKLIAQRCGGDEPDMTTRPVLPEIGIGITGDLPMRGSHLGRIYADCELLPKTTNRTGVNELLILYLVFAATITTRYRKVISE